METSAHHTLKRLALAFLREHGCAIAATEVTCPIARFRVDVAGYADRPARRQMMFAGEGRGATSSRSAGRSAGGGGRHEAAPRMEGTSRAGAAPPPRTIMLECKRSRGDFLRDRRDLERLHTQRRDLQALHDHLTAARLSEHELGARRGEAHLFAELDVWDETRIRDPACRATRRELARLDRLIHGETKFFLAARYRLADRLYIVAPRGLIIPRDLPAGWGLLECPAAAIEHAECNADLFGQSVLEVRHPAPALDSRGAFRMRLLRNIAAAASSASSRALGVLV